MNLRVAETLLIHENEHPLWAEISKLRAENERLKAELKSIDSALNDPRANLTLTTAEVILEIKAELAEAQLKINKLKKESKLWHT